MAPGAESVAQAQTENNPFNSGQKFATIGRTNPFSSPNKSKNPFLDRLDAPSAPTVPAQAPAPAPVQMVPQLVQTATGQQIVYAQVAQPSMVTAAPQPQVCNILGPNGQIQQVQVVNANPAPVAASFASFPTMSSAVAVPMMAAPAITTATTATTFSTSTLPSAVMASSQPSVSQMQDTTTLVNSQQQLQFVGTGNEVKLILKVKLLTHAEKENSVGILVSSQLVINKRMRK